MALLDLICTHTHKSAGRNNAERPNSEFQLTSEAKPAITLSQPGPTSALSMHDDPHVVGASRPVSGVNANTVKTELEMRIEKLEAKLAVDSSNDLADLLSVDIEKTAGAPAADTSADDAKKDNEGKTSKISVPNPCLHLWGGPIMPASDQTIW